MRTYTTTYDRESSQAERRVTCPGCGGKRTIRRTFSQTVNPWNRHDDGAPKTRREVFESVTRQAMEWEPSGEDLWHGKCIDEESA